MSINKILIPLDGSEHAEKIGDWVTGIARALDAEVAIVTVIDPDQIELPESTADHGHPIPGRPGPYDRPGIETSGALGGATGIVGGATTTPGRGGGVEHAPGFGTQIIDRVMQQAGAYVEHQAKALSAKGLTSSYTALAGDPAEEIVRYASEVEAGMIAMATHRGSAIARGVLGSVTDRVLRSSTVPVMAVHPKQMNTSASDDARPESVLVPVDGSERSTGAVQLALDLAKAIEAEVVFVRVVEYPYYSAVAAEAFIHSSEYGMAFQRREAAEAMKSLEEMATAQGLANRSIVVTGSPAAEILAQVESLPAPLVVMGSRGRSGLKRWVLGSVTDKVVRSAGVPTLVVPPHSSKDE